MKQKTFFIGFKGLSFGEKIQKQKIADTSFKYIFSNVTHLTNPWKKYARRLMKKLKTLHF